MDRSSPNTQAQGDGHPKRRRRRTKAKTTEPTSIASVGLNHDQKPLLVGKSEVKASTMERQAKTKHEAISQERSESTKRTRADKVPIILGNLRLLIYADHPHAKHLRQEMIHYHKTLIAEHRIPSSVIPPLHAITHLFSSLETLNHLDQLSESDWNAYIFWLSHHKDHQSLSQLHHVALMDQKLGSKLSTTSYNILVNARLKVLRSEQTAGSAVGKTKPDSASSNSASSSTSKLSPQHSPLSVFESTIEWMEKVNVPCNWDLYSSWLRTAVQERNWLEGIKAWKRMNEKSAQTSFPPTVLAAYTVQCYMRTGNMAEATKLLRVILEQSITAHQPYNNTKPTRGELASRASSNDGESELEAGTNDAWIEFQKRQKQTLQGLEALEKKSAGTIESDWASMEALDKNFIHEWETTINPALIEAICLGSQDKDAASLACDLTLELFKGGHVLDKTKFRLLTRYIGACDGSEGAESFMRRLVELTRSTAPAKDTNGSGTPIKDARKMKKVIESTSRILAEVGLQEIVRQASAEQNFNRARKIFDGMAAQGIPLGLDTSEKLIVGLASSRDYHAALAVLEKSLQDKRVPSIKTANTLLRGLLNGGLLDESIAVFRELTEVHEMKPDVQMYRSLMGLTSAFGQTGMTLRIMSLLKGLGVKRDGNIYRDLMLCYVRAGNLEGAIKVFHALDSAEIAYEIGHINALLEGAVRQSSSATILGILEIMNAQEIRPSPETWNILLGGALRAKDRLLAQELFQELAHAVVRGANDKADGPLRAARHPETFQLLMHEYAERYGIDPALKLLKGALDAGFPSQVAPSMYRDLIDVSCKQGNGIAGYKVFQLLRQSEHVGDQAGRKVPKHYRKKPRSFTSLIATMPSSPSAAPPSLLGLYKRLMNQLDHDGQIELGKEMATDLILSGFEMNQDLVAGSIRFYAKTGELTAAFGLFTKMGRVYEVEPSKEMVQDLYEAALSNGLLGPSSKPSHGGRWDESVVQPWIKVLRACMEKFGVYDVDPMSR
ncbi:hypothetical protein BGX27_010402 [Mortierella sp. AM989]|nr:hypothetical protein BGX27_010402 [Mortierella sp. AM989]